MLVYFYRLHIHGILHMRGEIGSHDERGALGDEEIGVAKDSQDVDIAGDVAGERDGDYIDEGDDQNRGKLEPKEGLEDHRAIPILGDGLPFLDQYGIEIPSFHEGE